MRPLLEPGAVVWVRRTEPGRLRRGDIAALRTPEGRLVLHRFLGLDGQGRLLTRGDARDAADPPWAPTDLVGVLRAVETAPGRAAFPDFSIARVLAFVTLLRPRWVRRFAQQCLLPLALGKGRRMAPRQSEPTGSREPADDAERWEVQQLGARWAVYDRTTGALAMLSPTAYAIWMSAREGTTREEIEGAFLIRYPDMPQDELRHDLEKAWEDLTGAGLVTHNDIGSK